MLGNFVFFACIVLWLWAEVWQKSSAYQDKESQMSFSWIKGFFFGGAVIYAVTQMFG